MDLYPIPPIPSLKDWVREYYPEVWESYKKSTQGKPKTLEDFLGKLHPDLLDDYAIVRYRE